MLLCFVYGLIWWVVFLNWKFTLGFCWWMFLDLRFGLMLLIGFTVALVVVLVIFRGVAGLVYFYYMAPGSVLLC